MEKYELSLPEKIIMVLIYMIPPALIFAIVQSAVTHNRVYFGWLILLAIIAAMYFVGGITMVTVPVRFREQKTMTFLHYKTYMVKNGIIAAGNHLRDYPVFTLVDDGRTIHSEAIGPVKSSEIDSRFKEHQTYTIWINKNHPSQCCTDRYRVVAMGALELALSGAMIIVILILI